MAVSFLLTSFSDIKTTSSSPKIELSSPYLKKRFSILYPDSDIHLTPMSTSSRKIKGLKLYATILATLGLIFLSQDFRTSFYLYSRNLSVVLTKKTKPSSPPSSQQQAKPRITDLIPLDQRSIGISSSILERSAQDGVNPLKRSLDEELKKRLFDSPSKTPSIQSSIGGSSKEKRLAFYKSAFSQGPIDPRNQIIEVLKALQSPNVQPPFASSGRSQNSSNSNKDSSPSSLETSMISLGEYSSIEELSTLSSADVSDLLVFWTKGSLLPFLEHDFYLKEKDLSPFQVEELLNLEEPEDTEFIEMGYCFLTKNCFTGTSFGEHIIKTCFNPLKEKYDEKDLKELEAFQNSLIRASSFEKASKEVEAFQQALTEVSAFHKGIINEDQIKDVGYYGYCWLQKIKKDPSYPPAKLWKTILQKKDEETSKEEGVARFINKEMKI